MKSIAVFDKYINENGLKLTKQRELIVSIFFAAGKHVSADELHHKVLKKDKSIGIATVYRTLRLLCEAGLAREHKFIDNQSRFEPLLSNDHHDHLYCVKCGKVEEFENPTIEKLQDAVAKKYGFQIESHKLEIYGLCKKCK